MFDKLRQSIGVPLGQSQIQQPNKPPLTLISHIVHLAAAPPDGSLHPVWNANSKFDQLTWATLPDEFRQVHLPSYFAFLLSHPPPKRQINYSIVTIRPIPRFKEIFLSVRISFWRLLKSTCSLESRQTPQMPPPPGSTSRRTTQSCFLASPQKVRTLQIPLSDCQTHDSRSQAADRVYHCHPRPKTTSSGYNRQTCIQHVS